MCVICGSLVLACYFRQVADHALIQGPHPLALLYELGTRGELVLRLAVAGKQHDVGYHQRQR